MKRILLFMALICVSMSALAQKEFTGAGDGSSWEDPNNWSDNSVPENGDDIYINGSYINGGVLYLRYSTNQTYGSLQLA